MNDIVTIKINFDEYKNDSKMICYEDFYTKSGVLGLIEPNYKGQYHYSNIQANDLTIKKIDDILRHNLVETKNKYSKIYKEKVLENMSALDRLQWSPKTNNCLEDDTIKVVLPTSDEYVKIV